MIEKKPDYEQFAKQFTWKGDQEQLIDYLLAVKSPLCKTLLLESTQTNVAAFAKAYSFLKEIAAQDIMEITFITAVLSLDFQSYTDAIVRYIEDAFVAHPDDKDRIIRPIVSKLVMRVHFVTGILSDACAITRGDTAPLYPLLDVAKRIPLCQSSAAADLAALADSCRTSTSEEARALSAALAPFVK